MSTQNDFEKLMREGKMERINLDKPMICMKCSVIQTSAYALTEKGVKQSYSVTTSVAVAFILVVIGLALSATGILAIIGIPLIILGVAFPFMPLRDHQKKTLEKRHTAPRCSETCVERGGIFNGVLLPPFLESIEQGKGMIRAAEVERAKKELHGDES